MTTCPYCNYKATNHETLAGETKPNEGDVSFCINCGEVNKFKEGELIKVDMESLDEKAKGELNDIRVAWLKTRAMKSIK